MDHIPWPVILLPSLLGSGIGRAFGPWFPMQQNKSIFPSVGNNLIVCGDFRNWGLCDKLQVTRDEPLKVIPWSIVPNPCSPSSSITMWLGDSATHFCHRWLSWSLMLCDHVVLQHPKTLRHITFPLVSLRRFDPSSMYVTTEEKNWSQIQFHVAYQIKTLKYIFRRQSLFTKCTFQENMYLFLWVYVTILHVCLKHAQVMKSVPRALD